MSASTRKPTSSETSLAQRQQMVSRHAAGASYQQIADALGVSRRTVMRWVTRERRAGADALAYRSRRRQQPHPATLSAARVARIDALRRAHPGWGPRLIRRQLLLDGERAVPAESPIRRWLRRLGHPSVRAAPRVPLGWRCPRPTPGESVWQIDFKEKRLPATPAEKRGTGS
jgi:transposase